MHRALRSLIEELEAVDWYAQRVDASDDEELAAVLAHNGDEEKEHACMVLEWIRRRDPKFDESLRRFLFQSGPIAALEEKGSAERETPRNPTGNGSLRIGGLRAQATEAK